MARRVNIELVDDLDGTPAEETVTFGLDGVSYEIDLSAANAAKLHDELEKWVSVARRVGGRRGTGKKRAGGPSSDDVREWARANGHQVASRGRVSAEVMAAYEAAH